MIKDFDIVKQQLQDLSTVINTFKSEAVQLKVVELLFQRMGIQTQEPHVPESKTPTRKNKGTRKNTAATGGEEKAERKPRKSNGGRPGPGAMVAQLIGEGFFKIPKTIQNIIDHCQSTSAYAYKPNELSVTMTRALRSGSLKRTKNAEKQFEYSE